MSMLNISEQIQVGFAGGRLCLKQGMEEMMCLSYCSYLAVDVLLKTYRVHHALLAMEPLKQNQSSSGIKWNKIPSSSAFQAVTPALQQ